MALFVLAVQRLELQKNQTEEGETVRGQIVISLISRDRGGGGTGGGGYDPLPFIRDENELPEG